MDEDSDFEVLEDEEEAPRRGGQREIGGLLVYQPTSEVPEPPRWVWSNRIPLGMVTLLDGDPGLGKSTLTADLAARVSRGWGFPDGTSGDAPGHVVIMSAEDDPRLTIQPRLLAAGADTDRVEIIQGLRDPDTDEVGPPAVPTDLHWIRAVVNATGARLVVIDPFVAYLDSAIDSHRDAQVRRAMSALKLLAEECEVAVLLIRHLNKNAENSNALYRGGGSIGIIAHARSAMVVARSKEDPHTLVLAQSKLNIGPKPKAINFRVEPWEDHPAWGRIVWGEESDVTADELLKTTDGREPTKRIDAGDWLLSLLRSGPMRATDIADAAAQEDFSQATFNRARRELRDAGLIQKRKVAGDDPHWVWFRVEEGGE